MVKCLAMGTLFSTYTSNSCFSVELAAASRFSQFIPQTGIHRRFSLPQSRLGFGLAKDNTGADMAVSIVRSAQDQSYIGVDGESLLFQLQEAHVWWRTKRIGVESGLIDNLWVISQNQAWEQRNISLGAAEHWGWDERSDLGVTTHWRSKWHLLAIQMRSGEGLRYRERNDGQSSSALLQIHGWGNSGKDPILVDVFAQEGSRTAAKARDHRLGGRLHGRKRGVRVGVEYLQAWGLQGDPLTEASLLSGWVRYDSKLPITGYLRFDQQWVEESSQNRMLGGIGWKLSKTARAMLGGSLDSSSVNLVDFPGAEGLQSQQNIFLQLDVNHQASIQLKE